MGVFDGSECFWHTFADPDTFCLPLGDTGVEDTSIRPTGVTSASTVGSPALTAVSGITVTGVTSASTVGSPALSGVSGISPTGVTSASTVGSPAVTSPGIGIPTVRYDGGSSSSPLTTGSITIPSGDRILAISYNRRASGAAPAAATISDTQGLTWTQVIDQAYDTAANPRLRVTIYEAASNGSATTVTMTSGGTFTTFNLLLLSYSGAAAVGSNKQAANSATGDPSVTLSSPAGTSAVIGGMYGDLTSGTLTSNPSGYTSLVSRVGNGSGTAAAGYVNAVYDLTSPAASLAWVTDSNYGIGWALEIPAA
jgi:hypothetical protein